MYINITQRQLMPLGCSDCSHPICICDNDQFTSKLRNKIGLKWHLKSQYQTFFTGSRLICRTHSHIRIENKIGAKTFFQKVLIILAT